MNLNDVSVEAIENMIKLMVKHQLQEISIGEVKIVKTVHLQPTQRRRRGRPAKVTPQVQSLIQDAPMMAGVPEEVLYAVSGPPKNGYSNLKASNILPNWNKASGE